MRQRIHIDAMLERGHGSRQRARSDLQQVGAAGDERLVTHPDDMGGKLVDEFWGFARLRKNIATRDVDLAIKGQGDGVARLRTIERALVGHDLLDSRGSAQARNDQLIAGRDRSRHYPAGKAAELRVWSVHPLDRKAERQLAGAARNLDRMQVLDQGRSPIPRHSSRSPGNVVAISRGQRDRPDRGASQTRREFRKARGDLLETALVEGDQVHLIDGKDEVTDSE